MYNVIISLLCILGAIAMALVFLYAIIGICILLGEL